ncbi:MAG: hypothetical protein FJX95_09700 [Bacteroidetes bacterium]|nr:hypothetical protein [Bacteroidota bacterium]
MARELSMNGNTKLKTIMQEFNDRFPFLILFMHASSEREKTTKSILDVEKTISEVREKKSEENALIRGGQKVKNLEKMMDDHFGLYCQVGYRDENGKAFYTSNEKTDNMTLRELNEYGSTQNWKKGIWK